MGTFQDLQPLLAGLATSAPVSMIRFTFSRIACRAEGVHLPQAVRECPGAESAPLHVVKAMRREHHKALDSTRAPGFPALGF